MYHCLSNFGVVVETVVVLVVVRVCEDDVLIDVTAASVNVLIDVTVATVEVSSEEEALCDEDVPVCIVGILLSVVVVSPQAEQNTKSNTTAIIEKSLRTLVNSSYFNHLR
ncbi:MAG: hypothetical protein IJO75_01110 [Clostridia bacterium]|nr:hypothetical protein [Clostridia bacterium]